jgi:hypothetical protein
MAHPDFTADYPQSGEHFRGFASFRAQLQNYPGGLPETAPADVAKAKVVGDEERWAITRGYTVLPLAGPERYTIVTRVPYPDGSRWWVVSIITLRDEKIFHTETYFAPEFEAPEWRRGLSEPMPHDPREPLGSG